MKLNRNETAQKLNVALTTLDDWRRKGCPHTKEGKQVYFDFGALLNWLDQRSNSDLDYTQERAKLTRLKAEKVALELDELRSKLIPSEMVVLTWQGMLANARAKLLALPPKAASLAMGVESCQEVEQIFRYLVYEALDELAQDGLPEEHMHRLEHVMASIEAHMATLPKQPDY